MVTRLVVAGFRDRAVLLEGKDTVGAEQTSGSARAVLDVAQAVHVQAH